MPEVDNLVSNMSDFTAAEIIDKVEVAFYYCLAKEPTLAISGGSVGTSAITIDSTNHCMAVSMLANAVLLEARKASKSRSNPSLVVRTIDMLFTPEMSMMLLIGDAQNEDNFGWFSENPTEDWVV